VLTNNGGDDLTLNNGDTTFTFATSITDDDSYDVAVKTNPTGIDQICIVAEGGSGTVDGSNVTGVVINCSTTYSIGGSVSGLSSTGLVLRNNGGDDLTLDDNVDFTFTTAIADGQSYNVTVHSAPAGVYCGVGSGSGTVDGANVTNVTVTCHDVSVAALYPTNGAKWNEYVKNDAADAYHATDADCVGDETGGYYACIHGGEKRSVEVPDHTSCDGLQAEDTLDAFDWTCAVILSKAHMVTVGLKDGKHLSDLVFADAGQQRMARQLGHCLTRDDGPVHHRPGQMVDQYHDTSGLVHRRPH
jgi:hypothetical protein